MQVTVYCKFVVNKYFDFLLSVAARDKAMVVNLEFIKAIVTAEEVLLLDPLRQEVLLFVDQLRQQLPQKGPSKINEDGQLTLCDNEGLQAELPFEFHVLEIALEVVCTYLDSRVEDLEREAYPVLDELARNVSTKNLEHVRGLKSNLTRLLARVQKVSLIIHFSILYQVFIVSHYYWYSTLTNQSASVSTQ